MTTATPHGASLTVDGVRLEGRFPRLLIWVRRGGQALRDCRYWLRRLSLDFGRKDESGAPLPEQTAPNGDRVYLVYGLPSSVLRLRDGGFGFLRGWEYVLDVRLPRGAPGCGPEKAGPSKPGRPRPPTAENPGGLEDGPNVPDPTRSPTWSEESRGDRV
jgi:hypothetical protein